MTRHKKWLNERLHKRNDRIRAACVWAERYYSSIGNWEDLRTYYAHDRLKLL